jgi:hypothetical protein
MLPPMHPHPSAAEVDREAAIDILLLFADADARWGEYDRALDLLDEVCIANGGLSTEYELKRGRWLSLASSSRHRIHSKP